MNLDDFLQVLAKIESEGAADAYTGEDRSALGLLRTGRLCPRWRRTCCVRPAAAALSAEYNRSARALIPGVVSPNLSAALARPAPYGDLVTRASRSL